MVDLGEWLSTTFVRASQDNNKIHAPALAVGGRGGRSQYDWLKPKKWRSNPRPGRLSTQGSKVKVQISKQVIWG